MSRSSGKNRTKSTNKYFEQPMYVTETRGSQNSNKTNFKTQKKQSENVSNDTSRQSKKRNNEKNQMINLDSSYSGSSNGCETKFDYSMLNVYNYAALYAYYGYDYNTKYYQMVFDLSEDEDEDDYSSEYYDSTISPSEESSVSSSSSKNESSYSFPEINDCSVIHTNNYENNNNEKDDDFWTEEDENELNKVLNETYENTNKTLENHYLSYISQQKKKFLY
ncbi:hypothetical protein WA158_007790 [Blastocystis sp. Blastoise]